MENRIIHGNKTQDIYPWNILRHERHYTYTGEESQRNAESVLESYKAYLIEEKTRFIQALSKANESNCAKALKSLGRLSHSWQDYYGHGVQLDKSLSVEERRDITAYVNRLGSPENIGVLYPASWSYNPKANTEHPPLFKGEPFDPESPGFNDRWNASVSFVETKFKKMLPDYWDACVCYAEKLLTSFEKDND